MDQRNEFSKWISAVEEALADDGKPLAEEKPESNECGCDKWSCKTCFPDNTATEEPKPSKGVKLGDIVTKTEYRMKDSGNDSPLTHAEDNLDENPDQFSDHDTAPPQQGSLDVEQPLFGEESQLGEPTGDHNYTDQDDAMDLISSIKYMQDLGFSNSRNVYDENQLAGMSLDELTKVHSEVMGNTAAGPDEPDVDEATAPMGEPKKPKTDTKQDDDPFWNDMDNMFNPKPDQPLANIPDDGEAPAADAPAASLPAASRQSTQSKLSNMRPTDQMRGWMGSINRDELTPDTEEPVIPQNELVIRTARDVPAVIGSAMQAAGVQTPEWHNVNNLPGFNDPNIRSMGKSVFSMFTSTPLAQIQTIANVDDQGPNTDAELRAVAGWLRDNAEDLGKVELSHGMAIPGYRPDVKEYRANGIRFHVVRDPMGQYIYAYPDKDARLQGPAPRDPGTRLGGGNTPRLRESNKGNNMSLSLFEELELDQAIKSALRRLVEDEEIEESTLSKEIAWKPGAPGKQEKNQGGWNLLQLLHRNHKLSNEAEMEPLPFNRDVLYGFFKNHPDHFIIVKGTHGVAAIRPSEEYFKYERNKPKTRARPNPKGFAADPNKELNSPYLQYQVIAFQNDGKQLDSSLFKDVEATDKEDGDDKKFSTTDPTVQRLRMGLYHGKDTQSQYNVFKLLADEIGRLTTMYISGFYALRKGQMGDQKGAEPVIKPHTGSVEREKMKARADLKAPSKPMDTTTATTKIFNRIRPVLQPIVAKAYSKVSLALQDAVRDDHQADLERLSGVRKAINEIKIAIDTKGNVPVTGTLASVLGKALMRATGFQTYDKQYAPALSELANGPAMKLEPLIQALRKTLIGAVR